MQRLHRGAAWKLEKGGADREGQGGTLSGAAVINGKVDPGQDGYKGKGKTVKLQGDGGAAVREQAKYLYACI